MPRLQIHSLKSGVLIYQIYHIHGKGLTKQIDLNTFAFDIFLSVGYEAGWGGGGGGGKRTCPPTFMIRGGWEWYVCTPPLLTHISIFHLSYVFI